ncbi:hypothetical protein [Tuwongella immobilis]|uniref:PDZ domain-containing protein n=1 Tax=Tuwongella immobilis TaxID=692036 RepID=A0A6C2YSZ2_9BACT|nr:hypothetical protein [Tuwongella immobilis]VIP04576.1 unnamed protein product [Tuwongella immobilis]VTS06513.1 unnamed protein product [Tuwongella immobilis]
MNKLMRIGMMVAMVVGVMAPTSRAQNTPSGLLLGIYAAPSPNGLRVINTIPGTPAVGILQANDKLMRATPDGVNVYDISSPQAIEQAKDQIGVNVQTYLEVFRPGVGMIYPSVTFVPVGGGVRAMATYEAPVAENQRFFKKPDVNPTPTPKPMPRPMPTPVNPFPNQPGVNPFPMPQPFPMPTPINPFPNQSGANPFPMPRPGSSLFPPR